MASYRYTFTSNGRAMLEAVISKDVSDEGPIAKDEADSQVSETATRG